MTPAESPPAPDADSASPFEPPPGHSGEVPPVRGGAGGSAETPAPRRRGLFDRLKKKVTPGSPGAPTREKTPKPSGGGRSRRLSAAETLADLWSGGGSLMARTGHTPTGRMIAFQGPAAGELLDEVVKGTMVDRLVVQKIVGARSTLDTLFAIFGPPAITWQMEKAMAAGDEQKFHALEEALKSAIKSALPVMVPAMKKARKREAEQQAALVELLDISDLEMMGVVVNPEGQPINRETGQVVDVGDIFVSMLFAEWVPPAPPPAPSEEEMAHNG